MRELVWTPAFTRAAKRLLRSRPGLRLRIETTLERMADDVFQTSLSTHKLKGDLDGIWACSIDYDNRILFKFVMNPETNVEDILLVALGTHDEVY